MLPDKPVIHFAHSAYRLDSCFAARGTGLESFQTWTPEDTLARIAEGDVLVLSGFWRNAFLERASRLRFIQVCAAGFDQFDQLALCTRGIRLANASGINANAVSDHAMGLLLALTRMIHTGRDNQNHKVWRPMISDFTRREEELPGKTMLIYGLGRIGGRLARLAKAFGMTVIGMRRSPGPVPEEIDEMQAPAALLSVLPRVDVAALTCPLTAETRNLADAAFFAALPHGAYFINVARGGCMDEVALEAALVSGRLAGAGIDVTPDEPLPASSPLWGLSNALITPHTAGETRHYEARVIDILIDNLGRLKRGETALLNGIV